MGRCFPEPPPPCRCRTARPGSTKTVTACTTGAGVVVATGAGAGEKWRPGLLLKWPRRPNRHPVESLTRPRLPVPRFRPPQVALTATFSDSFRLTAPSWQHGRATSARPTRPATASRRRPRRPANRRPVRIATAHPRRNRSPAPLACPPPSPWRPPPGDTGPSRLAPLPVRGCARAAASSARQRRERRASERPSVERSERRARGTAAASVERANRERQSVERANRERQSVERQSSVGAVEREAAPAPRPPGPPTPRTGTRARPSRAAARPAVRFSCTKRAAAGARPRHRRGTPAGAVRRAAGRWQLRLALRERFAGVRTQAAGAPPARIAWSVAWRFRLTITLFDCPSSRIRLVPGRFHQSELRSTSPVSK